MNILFHHIRKTGGTFLRGVFDEVHGIKIDPCYTDADLRACAEKIVSDEPGQMLVFGHRVADIAAVAKAFRPDFLEVGMFRDPDEIIVSEYNYILATEGHAAHSEAMASPDAETFAMEHLRVNPILSDLGARRPDKWYSFYDMKDAYRGICEDMRIEPMRDVMRSIRQAHPTLPDLGGLNRRDYEFLREINIVLPKK